MGAALVLLLVGLGAMAAGVLIGRYYVPDDRQLRRSARHSRAYMRALSHLVARDHETVISELRSVVEENVDDVEPYFALGAMFRSRGEHERAIRVHQALALRERDRRKLRQRAMYELGLDFRAAGMPRRATRAMEEVLLEEPDHESALRVLAALYEEQARFNEAAGLWQRLGRRRGEQTGHREHHLLVAAAQAALGRDDLDSARQLLKAAQRHEDHAGSAHFFAAAAELAAARHNHRGATERLKQALIAEPALAPHLLPGLIAAEQGRLGPDADTLTDDDGDDLDDEALAPRSAPLPLAAPAVQSRLPAAPIPQLAASSATAASDLAAPAADLEATVPAPGASSSPTAPEHAGAASAPVASALAGASSPAAGDLAGRSSVAADLAGRTAAASAPAAPALAGPSVAASDLPGRTPTQTTLERAAAPSIVAPAVAGSATSSSTAAQPSRTTAARIEVRKAVRGADAAQDAGSSPAALSPHVAAAVLAVLADVEAQTGPRLELALIRAQLVPAADATGRADLADQLMARFPASLAARVAAARLALASDDAGMVRAALRGLVADDGALAWTLRGRWQCAHCGNRPDGFSWRCGRCRRWGTLRMETGVEPPPLAPRERRAAPRTPRPEALLGASPGDALPTATIDPGLSDGELAIAGTRRSLLGRVGGWVSGVLRRDAS